MSRLSELLQQASAVNPELGKALAEETRALTKRRNFGLVFEQHRPESVRLPGRPVRRGDKVHVLPARGSAGAGSMDLWRVTELDKSTDPAVATVAAVDNDQRRTVSIDDLVVVAEHRDRIYPGLTEVDRVERDLSKPFHTVINAENLHALELLGYTHRHAVDVIYIDPPYNTGAKDWKYNNDYVDGQDAYRHSKWLSFMERRLLLAKELLNPADSVLILTIDEKEYTRIGILLEQVFPEARIQMVSSNINPAGSSRPGAFGRADEYLYFVKFGKSAPAALSLGMGEWLGGVARKSRGGLLWNMLNRTGTGALRSDSPNLFYPVFVTADATRFVGVGDPLGIDEDKEDANVPEGAVAIWPIRRDGTEGRWMLSAGRLREMIAEGFVRLGRPRGADTTINYLKAGEANKVRAGLFPVIGRADDGSVIVDESGYQARYIPTSQWRIGSHDASRFGSGLVASFLPDRSFTFPKSLYAVEDALRFFVADKPDAVIVDFFAGSGTTGHAVARLNHADGGRRQAILVTNNEVSADESKTLTKKGLRPGDPEWEALGIARYVTFPRLKAAITGIATDGNPVKGRYSVERETTEKIELTDAQKSALREAGVPLSGLRVAKKAETVTDPFDMADGMLENAAFFDLTYESPLMVGQHRAFERIAPLLWLRAGARGAIVESIPEAGWALGDTYAIIENMDRAKVFVDALAERDEVTLAYIVTDDDRRFQMLCAQLPSRVTAVRLYESYLMNFEVNTGRGVA